MMAKLDYVLINGIVYYSYNDNGKYEQLSDNIDNIWFENIKDVDIEKIRNEYLFVIGDARGIFGNVVPYTSEVMHLNGEFYEAKYIRDYKKFKSYKRKVNIDSII